MKLYLLVSLSALASFSLALAAESSLDGARLGQMEAVVAHCGKLSPADNARYRELLRPVVADASTEDLAAARKTEAYRRAYEEVSGQLSAAKKEEAIAACDGAVAANN